MTEFTIAPEAKQHLEAWKSNLAENQNLYVGVDIGATNTRVAISRATHSGFEFVELLKVQSNTSTKLFAALRSVAEQVHNILEVPIVSATLAGAGPVQEEGHKLEVTNFIPNERLLDKEKLPPTMFPPGRTFFINDLESTCWGINSLDDSDLLKDFFKVLWGSCDQYNELKKTHNFLVVAVGTGLGIASLLSIGRGHRRTKFQVVPMEFGHVNLSITASTNKDYAEEQKIISYISRTVYESKHTPEYEDIVSGRGLVSTYEALAAGVEGVEQTMDAGLIAEKGIAGTDPYAVKAMYYHYKFLFRVLKTLSVGLLCGGILLAGGNQVNNNPFLEAHLDELKAEFLDHPKPHWLQHITVLTQTKDYNINLAGALFAARD